MVNLGIVTNQLMVNTMEQLAVVLTIKYIAIKVVVYTMVLKLTSSKISSEY